VSVRIPVSTKVVESNLFVRSARHASGDGNGDAGVRFVANTRECACLFVIATRNERVFSDGRLKTRGDAQAATARYRKISFPTAGITFATNARGQEELDI